MGKGGRGVLRLDYCVQTDVQKGVPSPTTATLVSVSAFLEGMFFIGFVLFFRGFEAIGPFVNMIYRMCAGDMSRFFIIYIIYVVGLAQGEHALECNSVPRGLGTKGNFFRERRDTS